MKSSKNRSQNYPIEDSISTLSCSRLNRFMGLVRGEDPRLHEDDITNGEQIQKKILNQVQDDIFLYFSGGIILCFEKSEYFAFFDAYDILNPNLARGSISAKRGSKSPKIKDPLVVGLLFFLNLSLVAIVFSRQNEGKLKPKENSSDPGFFQESHICEVYQSKSPTPKKEWERWDYREEDILHKSSMR